MLSKQGIMGGKSPQRFLPWSGYVCAESATSTAPRLICAQTLGCESVDNAALLILALNCVCVCVCHQLAVIISALPNSMALGVGVGQSRARHAGGIGSTAGGLRNEIRRVDGGEVQASLVVRKAPES
eukprot:4464519-Pleurochrysis_carterae.AAC.1